MGRPNKEDVSWGPNTCLLFTCLLKSRCSKPFLGCGEGKPFQSRSGGTVPSMLNTFNSLKHSVSIICGHDIRMWSGSSAGIPYLREPHWGEDDSFSTFLCPLPPHQTSGRSMYLVLPRDGHTPCGKLLVEVVVCRLQFDTLDCGELLDIQHIFAVNSLGLEGGRERGSLGEPARPGNGKCQQVQWPRGPGYPLPGVGHLPEGALDPFSYPGRAGSGDSTLQSAPGLSIPFQPIFSPVPHGLRICGAGLLIPFT